MTEYCDVCGDPLSDHPDDFPCAPKPSYPELPDGCKVPTHQRQLSSDEIVDENTDLIWRPVYKMFDTVIKGTLHGEPAGRCIIIRTKETK